MIRTTLLTASVLALLAAPALATDISGNNDRLDHNARQKTTATTTTRQSKMVTRDRAYDPTPSDVNTYRRTTVTSSDAPYEPADARVYESTTYRNDMNAPRTYERETSYSSDRYAPRASSSESTMTETTIRTTGAPTYMKFNNGTSTQDFLSLR